MADNESAKDARELAHSIRSWTPAEAYPETIKADVFCFDWTIAEATAEIERFVADRLARAPSPSGETKTLAVAVYNIATRGPWKTLPPDWPEVNERIQEIAALLSSPSSAGEIK
jgi:hypothetical protein